MNLNINVIWVPTFPAFDLEGLDLLESTAATLFIAGHADSGKTTFVRHWRAITGETVAVLAPTGIAVASECWLAAHAGRIPRPPPPATDAA